MAITSDKLIKTSKPENKNKNSRYIELTIYCNN